MIDKLDVRIPEFALPGPILEEPLRQLKRQPVPLFQPSRYYQYVCDLRKPFDIDARLNLFLKFGRPNHKIEIIDAGEKTLQQMTEIITQLFDVDPWSLQVMRIDLAADMESVPVPWFKDHAYVNRKQFSSRIEKSYEKEVQFVAMGTAVAQTLYAGKRPVLTRIYDKLAEWRMQLRKIERTYRRFNAGMEELDMTEEQRYYGQLIPPTFKEYCKARGYQYNTGAVLTRIESQIGGNRIPLELATVGDLRHAHEFRPFSGLKIIPSGKEAFGGPPRDGVPLRDWLAAIGFERVKEQLGSAQLARSFVLRHGNGNGKRILESLAECRPANLEPVTTEEIQESFKRSTLLQTSQDSHCGVYLCPTYERKHTQQIA